MRRKSLGINSRKTSVASPEDNVHCSLESYLLRKFILHWNNIAEELKKIFQ